MLYHRQTPRFLQPLAPDRLILRLKTRRSKKQRCWVVYEDKSLKTAPMYPYAFTPHYIYYQAEVKVSRPWQVYYYFRCQRGDNPPKYLLAEGINKENRPFFYRWTPEAIFSVPDWIYDAVFYQIFPDRFYNADPSNDPPGTEPWGGEPTRSNFFGGDLEGIRAKIPYLQFLGVNAIWLNPIFSSPSNHRYDTRDYLEIDPALGDKTSLRQLTESLHAAGMRLILDGVFNHTGTEFWAFRDVVARGEDSPYRDWYYFHGFPVQTEPIPNYACWWNIPSLPKLKATNPEVRRYLLEVGAYWLREAGTDGWRLDVPNEIEPSFWREFRAKIKGTKPDAYIVGEIWRDARFWLQGRYFDGVMNYLFRDLVLAYFACRRFKLSTLDFLLGLIRLRYPEPSNFALLNLLGSHDTARIITAFQEGLAAVPGHMGSYAEAVEHLRPALILQMTYPGAPLIYYGDEVGMTGGPDPGCRRTMVWDTDSWDVPLLNFYRRLISIRHRLAPLRRGLFQPLAVNDLEEVYLYARRLDKELAIIAINASDNPRVLEIEVDGLGWQDGEGWRDVLGGAWGNVEGGRIVLEVGPNYGAIICR
ncbi:MAG: cyclomaltodextrinase / maltogenic alpha-amylase / neopullulanase [Clostridia bacterium]|nr:cyclomaltodextrinase / maltogenic alpha-amylase / neopullulanase [Clostridia bacterium]